MMTEREATNIELFAMNYLCVTRSWVISESGVEMLRSKGYILDENPLENPVDLITGKIKMPEITPDNPMSWNAKEVKEINDLTRISAEQRDKFLRRTNARQMLTSQIAHNMLSAFCNSLLSQKTESEKLFIKSQISEVLESAGNAYEADRKIRDILQSGTIYLKLKTKVKVAFGYWRVAYELFKWLLGFMLLFALFNNVESRSETILLAVVAILYIRSRLQVEGQATAFTLAINALEQEFCKLRWILNAEMPEESLLKNRKQQQDVRRRLILQYVGSFASLPVIGLVVWKILAAIGIIN